MKNLIDAIRPTTFVGSSKLKDDLGLDVTAATETFQHTGSFKFRAAYNLASTVPNQKIVSASSGNFGQALAYACKLVGKQCVVVMPETSARIKIEAVRKFGATANLVDTNRTTREDRVDELMTEHADAYQASAFNDELVIEGNASLGDELAGKGFDAVLVPIGGGGLISGILRGLRRSGDNVEVIGAEPQMANDASRSLRAGKWIPNEFEPLSIADGARTLSLGSLTWPIIRDNVNSIIEVPEEKIAAALRKYFALANLKCEPTGALTLGALMTEPERFRGKKVCVVVSGGNVDPSVYADLISG